MGPGLALWPPVEVQGSRGLTAGFPLLPAPTGLWGHFHRKGPALVTATRLMLSHLPWCKSLCFTFS